MAHDCRLIFVDFPAIVCYVDAFALSKSRWLVYPKLIRVLHHLCLKLIKLFRQHKSLWPEAEMMLAVLVLHPMYPVG